MCMLCTSNALLSSKPIATLTLTTLTTMTRAAAYGFHRNFLAFPFLVVVASVAADPGRWLSRRDFVFDTTNSIGNNDAETDGSELEFGQHRDIRIARRKVDQAGKRNNKKEVKRKWKLKKVTETNNRYSQNKAHHYNQQGKHGGVHYNNYHYGNEQKLTDYNDKHIDNIDTDLMGHILLRRSEPKSLDYQGEKSKKPTRKPTKKPSKQPTGMPVADTDGRTNNNFPTVSATPFPVASVADDTTEECSPSSVCYEEGNVCFSGQEECCGTMHASLECKCADVGDGNLQYMCFHTEACMSQCEEKASTDAICPINLRKSESLLDDLTLHYDVVGDNLCIRLEYENEGWIGLGFSSPDGRMVGSTAVIGIPDMKEGTSNPAYYALGGMVDSMITPLPESKQNTLQEATILQDRGLTIMTFAKSLIDDEHISVGENTFIFAAAKYNHFGYHDKRGSVTLYLSP